MRVVCPSYSWAPILSLPMFHWVLGYRGSRCASPGTHFQRRREGRCVLGIPRLSPLWLPFPGSGVCEGRCVPAIAGLSPSCFFCGFRGRCVRWCVLAIAGLPRLFVSESILGSRGVVGKMLYTGVSIQFSQR